MKNIVILVPVLLVFFFFSCKESSFTIDRNNIGSVAVIIPDSPGSIPSFAANELKKHLDLIFRSDIPITNLSSGKNYKTKVFVGIKPPGFGGDMKPEEAVYVIRGNSIWFFGDDAVNIRYTDENPGELRDKMLSEVLDLASSRTGTLFAVYNFLENELGIRWIKPGDQGLFYGERDDLSIPGKEVSWTPSLVQRNIRTGLFSYRAQQLYGKYAPDEFHLTEDEVIRKQTDVLIWMRRMRMGRSDNYRFGHAYTSYWEKYKDTDPLIFALNGMGERKPLGRIQRVKMCPTNPDLPGIVVREWQENLKKSQFLYGKSISGCENDSDGKGDDEWCHCDICMAKDERYQGEKLTDYVTDRYVYLWNAILKEARKYQSDILVTGYAYENMLQPPRREKLSDGLLIEFIPRMGGNFETTRKLYEGWRNAGMKMMMYRPNDMNWEIGIPFGQEERLFNNFKLALQNNAVGTDFDSMLGYWEGISDMTYYILSKGHVYTQASFDSLEKEFLDCFGEARGDIAKYYRHWRNIFNTKIIPEELSLNDGINTYFLEWHRLYRLTARIDDFYSMSDFDITDNYLKEASARNISDRAMRYIKRMQIANEHSRLTYKAFLAGKSGNRKQIAENAQNLVSFRKQNKEKVDINWNILFQYQYYQMDDQLGTRYLGFLPANLDSGAF